MQHPQIDEDFLQFESKVDQVMKLLQDVSVVPKNNADATDEKIIESQKPQLKADSVNEDNFIVTVRDNRTVINKRTTTDNAKVEPGTPAHMDQFTFMQQVEKDAEERAKARQERERIAQQFRNYGNAEFRKGNYEKAVLHFSKAIEHIKDSPILYCNRALCFIKLQNYKRAIIDCDYVLNKLDEKNMRGWLYRAVAYKRLGDEQNFETCVKFVRKYNSKQLDQIDNFLSKIDTEF